MAGDRGGTTALVATVGGHFTELMALADRLADRNRNRVWITADNAQTRSLLAGETVEFVPFIGERDVAGVLRAMPEARRLLRRHRVDRVVSTGAAIALAYLPTAVLLGAEAHYIESSARVTSQSMTGRLLTRAPGVRCWWQYDPAPDGFASIPGVYDHYRAEVVDRVTVGRSPGTGPAAAPPIRRVVVTVGTTDRCFRRLITRLIEILPPDVDVLWQTGHSQVDDLGIDARALVPEAELVAAIAEADVVVSHAGSGSLGLALAAGRCPVYVPRRAAAGEQIDDHQLELARWADTRGLAVSVEADRLEMADLHQAAARRIVSDPTEDLVLR